MNFKEKKKNITAIIDTAARQKAVRKAIWMKQQ